MEKNNLLDAEPMVDFYWDQYWKVLIIIKLIYQPTVKALLYQIHFWWFLILVFDPLDDRRASLLNNKLFWPSGGGGKKNVLLVLRSNNIRCYNGSGIRLNTCIHVYTRCFSWIFYTEKTCVKSNKRLGYGIK